MVLILPFFEHMSSSSIFSACNPRIRAYLDTLLLFDSARSPSMSAIVGSIKYSLKTLTTTVQNMAMASGAGAVLYVAGGCCRGGSASGSTLVSTTPRCAPSAGSGRPHSRTAASTSAGSSIVPSARSTASSATQASWWTSGGTPTWSCRSSRAAATAPSCRPPRSTWYDRHVHCRSVYISVLLP